jgi:hypothetical protein
MNRIVGTFLLLDTKYQMTYTAEVTQSSYRRRQPRYRKRTFGINLPARPGEHLSVSQYNAMLVELREGLDKLKRSDPEDR